MKKIVRGFKASKSPHLITLKTTIRIQPLGNLLPSHLVHVDIFNYLQQEWEIHWHQTTVSLDEYHGVGHALGEQSDGFLRPI